MIPCALQAAAPHHPQYLEVTGKAVHKVGCGRQHPQQRHAVSTAQRCAGAHFHRQRSCSAHSYAVDSTSDAHQVQQQQAARASYSDDAHSRWWEDWQHPCRCRVHYWQRGTRGPPIVLLHGFGVGEHDNQEDSRS
jgi:hypothetical protein